MGEPGPGALGTLSDTFLLTSALVFLCPLAPSVGALCFVAKIAGGISRLAWSLGPVISKSRNLWGPHSLCPRCERAVTPVVGTPTLTVGRESRAQHGCGAPSPPGPCWAGHLGGQSGRPPAACHHSPELGGAAPRKAELNSQRRRKRRGRETKPPARPTAEETETQASR